MVANFLPPPKSENENPGLSIWLFLGILVFVAFLGPMYLSSKPESSNALEQTQQNVKKTDSIVMQNDVIESSKESESSIKKEPIIEANTENFLKEKEIIATTSQEEVVLENEWGILTLDPNQGGVSSLTLKNHQIADRSKNIALFKGYPQFSAYQLSGFENETLVKIETKKEPSQQKIELIREFQSPTRHYLVEQTFSIQDQYKVKGQIKITNLGKGSLNLDTIKLSTGGLQPQTYLSDDYVTYEPHSIAGGTKKGITSISYDANDKDFADVFSETQNYNWVSAQNKYFTSVVEAVKIPFDSASPMRQKFIGKATPPSWFNQIWKSGNEPVYYTCLQALGIWKFQNLQSGQFEVREFVAYSGPKILSNIALLDPQIVEVMQLSYFSWFEFIARFLLQIMVWLKENICGSYGLAIIAITIVAKTVFWPIQTRANESMKKMQTLKPKMDEINKKYKDNPQVKNAKTMELYQKEGVHPVSGCLPIMLQIPVFIALYAAIAGAVELRHDSFLWATDLSSPDVVCTLFGIGIHPLVIAQAVLMILQQKLTPSNMDPVQQKMMMIMPLAMLFFFYNLPSGLTLYLTIQQILSLFQMWWNMRKQKQETTPQQQIA